MTMIGAFIWLFVFLLAGWAINKSKKKPVANGAEWYFWIFLAQIVYAAIMLYRPAQGKVMEVDPDYVFGSILGAYLIPMIIAAIMAWKFRHKKRIFQQSSE